MTEPLNLCREIWQERVRGRLCGWTARALALAQLHEDTSVFSEESGDQSNSSFTVVMGITRVDMSKALRAVPGTLVNVLEVLT